LHPTLLMYGSKDNHFQAGHLLIGGAIASPLRLMKPYMLVWLGLCRSLNPFDYTEIITANCYCFGRDLMIVGLEGMQTNAKSIIS